MLITVVADYGTGDLAFAEVRQTFAELLPEAEIAALPVPPFDTVSAGLCVAQPAFGAGPATRVIYANVAPRQDEEGAREDNAGERLSFAPGSSGWPSGTGAGDRMCFELLARGGNAAQLFDFPPSGTPVEVTG